MGKTSEELYQEREQRFNSAVQLKVPDRVPITLFLTFFGAKYAGLTFQEAMYDYDKVAEATRKTVVDFDPDMYSSPFPIVSMGPLMDILGEKWFKWPGHGVSANSTYQYVEGEYMTADEYDAFIADPTDYILRTHVPRVLGALEPLKMLTYIPAAFYLTMDVALPVAFAMPPVAQALETLAKAGQESFKMLSRGAALGKEMAELGFPCMIGSFSWAPFDYIGDLLRGTRGIMLDMYQRSG
jgi:hypothetical protein